MEKIRLGIVGLGRMGYQHAQNIHNHIPNAEITAACSVVPEELERVGAEIGPSLVTDSYAELLAEDGLDGIVIATSSQTHCEMICQAAAADKQYLFTEKPIGMSVEMEIYGSEGCIRVGTSPDKDRVTLMNNDGVHKQCAQWFFEYWEPTFLAEMEAFVACIRENKDPQVSLMDGYKAVAWAQAATEAVRSKSVVSLPNPPSSIN